MAENAFSSGQDQVGAELTGDDAPRRTPRRPAAQPPQEDEFDVWKGRTHWKHYSGRLLVWILCNAAVDLLTVWLAVRLDQFSGKVALLIILGLLFVSGGFVLGGIAVIILGRRYRLTSQRLFVHRGILSQTVDQMELIRVDDVRIHKTMLDRIFGLGSIEVLSTDASNRDLAIDGIAHPEELAEAIRTHMRRLRSRSLYVERL